MPVPVLGSSAAKMRDVQRTAAETPAVIEAVTAFIVYATPDGRYLPEYDLDAPLTVTRPPTRHEVIAGCEIVTADTRLQMQTEAVTANVLMNFARMQGDPNYHAMLAETRAQAEAAMHAAERRG